MSEPESLTLFGYDGVLYADSVQKRIKRLKELDQLRKEFIEELDSEIAELKKTLDLRPKKV